MVEERCKLSLNVTREVCTWRTECGTYPLGMVR